MNNKRFAKGYNIYKLIWIFLICSFIGAMVEIVWCYFVMGKLMSRSSLLYGQFSVVWGLGCVLLTVLLHKMEGKRDLLIFIVGAIAGGIYEYMCSVLTELVFGVRFWDYSKMALNIDGRINLLFCFFWGLIAVVWIQNLYPFLSKNIEKIPVKFGKQLTWLLALLMIINMSLSCMALIRGYQRQLSIPAKTSVDQFLDQHYPNEYLVKRYQNMLPKK